MTSSRGWLPAVAAGLILSAASLCAQPVHVPEELEDWRGWVLQGQEFRQCPAYFDRNPDGAADYLCAWPQALELEVDADGGRFVQRWRVSAGEAWLPLPGDTEHWPDQVTANGEPATVVLHDGVPSVRAFAGNHRLAGRFRWDETPGVLRVPPQSGLVALVVNGERVARPVFDRNGVFLGDRRQPSQTPDSIETSVYRLVMDDVPLRLGTVLRLDVAGTIREETFGPLLPPGYVPLALTSELPVRLEADGRLHAQVRPGTWEITLLARAAGVEPAVVMPEGRNNLPAEEIWSYRSNDRLRVTAASGDAPVDPGQADVPPDWAEYPAFRLEPGDTLKIEERSRGLAQVDNDLSLERSMWLDFDGAAYTIRDSVSGRMRRDWRLDMRPPYALASATEYGADLLVTAGDAEGETGVELRQADVNLEATTRSGAFRSLPVTGWDARFSSVVATLFLPPGSKLLAAPGADVVQGSWAGRWQLLDFFLLLLITIAAWRLFGHAAGIVALLALVLSFHELAAPTWLWLNLLLAVALLRVAPVGRLRNFVRAYLGLGALLLLAALVPFIAQQLRIAIYPQLEPQFETMGGGMPAQTAPAASPADSMSYGEDSAVLMEMERSTKAPAAEEIVVTANKVSSTDFPRYAPNATVQTGPGIPGWQWNAAHLRWNGPVDAAQTLKLLVLPRWAVSVLRFAEVALLLLFAAMIAARVSGRRWRLPGGLAIARSAGVVLLAACIGIPAIDARADTPSPEILDELEQRLTQAPECAPRCAEIVAAEVSLIGEALSLRLMVHALAEVAVPLPGTPDGWRPDAILVDNATSAEVLRGPDQALWLRVVPGRHAVTLRGASGDSDSLQIAFPAPPRVVDVQVEGWEVAGLRDRRLLSGALQFTRVAAEGDTSAPERWESSRFPPFAHIARTIEMGLDWTLMTTVAREAPVEGALTLRVPLLPGESVLAEGLPVSDGEMLISMAPGQDSVSWQSRLPRTSPLVLQAAAEAPWKETWRVVAGSIWHVTFEGVPESLAGETSDGARSAEFHPRAGESLTLSATRPDAVAGGTIAFDSVAVEIAQGERSRDGSLSLAYRSTRGAQHAIRLPADAELVSVELDDRGEALQLEDGVLTVPILPGEHVVEVAWRDPRPVGFASGVPAIDLGAPAGNITLDLQVPGSRWLLLAQGPKLGPSVLYWSELAALVLFAFLLARIPWTPLRFRHWLLLGLGFSTFNWMVAALVALWLVVVGARDRWRVAGTWWHYNLQQAVVIALTVLALLAIVVSLPLGLLGTPDMHVVGNGSTGQYLTWFADRTELLTPIAWAWSLPMWVYKTLILVWALWLSLALLAWLPWTWRCFVRDGFFRSRPAPGA